MVELRNLGAPFDYSGRMSIERILPHRRAALNGIEGFLCRPSGMGSITASRSYIVTSQIWRDISLMPPSFHSGYAQDELACLVAAVRSSSLLVRTSHRGPRVIQKSVREKQVVASGDMLMAEVRLRERRCRFCIFSAEEQS